MSDFWSYFKLGLEHVLDWNAYTHGLFLIVLVAFYTVHFWKKVFGLVLSFILGISLAFIITLFDVPDISANWVSFLIPLSVFLLALYNIINAKKKESKNNRKIFMFVMLACGIVHGLGLSEFFHSRFTKNNTDILFLFEYFLGIATAQLILMIAVLLLSFIVQSMLNVARRDWILVISALIIGLVLPILIKNYPGF